MKKRAEQSGCGGAPDIRGGEAALQLLYGLRPGERDPKARRTLRDEMERIGKIETGS
jgi:hypothetical protein